MGFYYYFRIASKNLPVQLRPFAPPVVYESARIMERFHIDETASLQTFKWVYEKAYDRIVERIGEKIAEENYILRAKKHVSYRDQLFGRKEWQSSRNA